MLAQAFAWDSVSGEAGEIGAFEESGYYFEFDDMLKTDTVHLPINYNDQLVIRPLESDADWTNRVELNLACSDVFTEKQTEDLGNHFRNDTLKIGGLFLGGFINDKLVGGDGTLPGRAGVWPDQHSENPSRFSENRYLQAFVVPRCMSCSISKHSSS